MGEDHGQEHESFHRSTDQLNRDELAQPARKRRDLDLQRNLDALVRRPLDPDGDLDEVTRAVRSRELPATEGAGWGLLMRPRHASVSPGQPTAALPWAVRPPGLAWNQQ